MGISGGSTTLSALIAIINERLGNYVKTGAADSIGDGVSTVFELPHAHIVAGSDNFTVDDVPTANTLNCDTGVVTATVAPAADSAIHDSYEYVMWDDGEITHAINEAMLEVWAELHETEADVATVVVDGETTEFELPDDCAYLYRVEFQATTADPFKKVRQWSVYDDGYVQELTLYQPEGSGTYRLLYIKNMTELVDGDDTIEECGIPTHGKWAIVWAASAILIAKLLALRTRSNQFFNVEGKNTTQVYELQRVMADYRALAELAIKKARRSPRITTT